MYQGRLMAVEKPDSWQGDARRGGGVAVWRRARVVDRAGGQPRRLVVIVDEAAYAVEHLRCIGPRIEPFRDAPYCMKHGAVISPEGAGDLGEGKRRELAAQVHRELSCLTYASSASGREQLSTADAEG